MELQEKKRQKITVHRLILLAVGNILIALGIAFFVAASFGSDPHSAMMLSIAGKLGTTFGPVFWGASAVYFVIEFIWGRHLIGIGTFFNWFLVSFFSDWFQRILGSACTDPGFLLRIFFMIAGLLIISMGLSLYQTVDMGVGPYDSLAIIMDERLPLPYFWCRIICDGTCALVSLLLGGFGTLIGIGSILCAFGLGPFITFFNKYSVRLVGKDQAE